LWKWSYEWDWNCELPNLKQGSVKRVSAGNIVSEERTKDRRKKCEKNKDGYMMLEYSSNKMKYLNARKNY
jgi:hypothetical protein